MDTTDTTLTWVGIGLCLIQSGLFSGLNLALLGVSRLQLEVEARSGNHDAQKILAIREDSNYLLTTILWGNVAVNCLLTLLSDSVLFGASAFAFSTVGITLVGEIVPQAYFSRNAIRVGALFSPFIRLYQWILLPVAMPSARLLDYWLGPEGMSYFREHELREVIRQHMVAEDADLEKREALGVLNFLVMDDLPIGEEGEEIHPESVVSLPVSLDLPRFPDLDGPEREDFLRLIHQSGEKWVILTGEDDTPLIALDADGFLREAMLGAKDFDPYQFCHRPLIVEDATTPLGKMVRRLRVEADSRQDDVVDKDVILLWGETKRIVTGADLLGRILRGIVLRVPPSKTQNTTS